MGIYICIFLHNDCRYSLSDTGPTSSLYYLHGSSHFCRVPGVLVALLWRLFAY